MQDSEYLESLRADKQKELSSLNKAESHSSKEQESYKKMLVKKVTHLLSLWLVDFVPAVGCDMNMKCNPSSTDGQYYKLIKGCMTLTPDLFYPCKIEWLITQK